MIAARDWPRAAHGAALLMAVVVVLAFYWPSVSALAALWTDNDRRTYTHGFLVVAISLWMLWRKRELVLRPGETRFAWPLTLALFVLLAATVILWQLSYRAGLALATEVLLLPLIWLAVLLGVGWNAARAALMPVCFLVFALTVWDYANPAAQWLSVHAVRILLRAVDLPAYFSGNDVHIPSGSFEIAEGCSGLHFIIVALLLAVLIGEIRDDNWRMRLAWCALALALALISNWARIFIIIAAGHVTHMQHYLVRESHYGFGWAVFAVALVVLFVIERRTPERPAATMSAAMPATAGPPPVLSWLACLAVLALPLVENFIIDARLFRAEKFELPDLAAAARESGWVASAASDSAWRPGQLAPDAVEQLRFERAGTRVETYRAVYREQKIGKKLGGQANRLQGDAQVIDSGTTTVAGRSFGTRLLVQEGRQSLMWFKYRAAGQEFTSATRAQLWYSWETVRLARSGPSEAFAAWTPCEPDCDAARAALFAFMTDIEDRK